MKTTATQSAVVTLLVGKKGLDVGSRLWRELDEEHRGQEGALDNQHRRRYFLDGENDELVPRCVIVQTSTEEALEVPDHLSSCPTVTVDLGGAQVAEDDMWVGLESSVLDVLRHTLVSPNVNSNDEAGARSTEEGGQGGQDQSEHGSGEQEGGGEGEGEGEGDANGEGELGDEEDEVGSEVSVGDWGDGREQHHSEYEMLVVGSCSEGKQVDGVTAVSRLLHVVGLRYGTTDLMSEASWAAVSTDSRQQNNAPGALAEGSERDFEGESVNERTSGTPAPPASEGGQEPPSVVSPTPADEVTASGAGEVDGVRPCDALPVAPSSVGFKAPSFTVIVNVTAKAGEGIKGYCSLKQAASMAHPPLHNLVELWLSEAACGDDHTVAQILAHLTAHQRYPADSRIPSTRASSLECLRDMCLPSHPSLPWVSQVLSVGFAGSGSMYSSVATSLLAPSKFMSPGHPHYGSYSEPRLFIRGNADNLCDPDVNRAIRKFLLQHNNKISGFMGQQHLRSKRKAPVTVSLCTREGSHQGGISCVCIGWHSSILTVLNSCDVLVPKSEGLLYPNLDVDPPNKRTRWARIETGGAHVPPQDGMTAHFVGSHICLFGGRDSENITSNDVILFNHATGEMEYPEVHGEPPPPRDAHASCVFNGLLWVFGGEANPPLNDIYVFDPASCEWSIPEIEGTPPPPRKDHVLVSTDDRLYVFGGESNPKLNDLYAIQPNDDGSAFTWTKVEMKGDIPHPRKGHSANHLGQGCFCVFGGDAKGVSSDLYIFDPTENVWSIPEVKGTPPPGRFCHQSEVIGDELVVFAGTEESSHYDLYTLNLSTLVWTVKDAHCAMGGEGLAMTADGVRLFVFGGEDVERPSTLCCYVVSVLKDLTDDYIHRGIGDIAIDDEGKNVFVRLDVSGLRLLSVEPLSPYIHLQTLNIAGNHLQDLSPLEPLHYLVSLDASYNDLEDAALTFGPLASSLSNLVLSGNKLTEIPDLSKLKFLKNLALDGNQIGAIDGLSNLSLLTTLSLARNNITKVANLEGLNVENLDLSRNGLDNPGSVNCLRCLRALSLDFNNIVTLEGLCGLPVLTYLSLAGNSVVDLSELRHLTGLPIIKMMDLTDNPVQSMENWRLHVLYMLSMVKVLDGAETNEIEKVQALNFHGGDMEHRRTMKTRYLSTTVALEGFVSGVDVIPAQCQEGCFQLP